VQDLGLEIGKRDAMVCSCVKSLGLPQTICSSGSHFVIIAYFLVCQTSSEQRRLS